MDSLARVDLRTGQSQDIRLGDPRGAIGPRRNFDVWSDGLPEPEMGNAMHPANWNALAESPRIEGQRRIRSKGRLCQGPT